MKGCASARFQWDAVISFTCDRETLHIDGRHGVKGFTQL